ncbi:MAG: tetratricopeptide repeat protein [Chloroflexi bacterium]|nr:tetratricopeptide repeat protein [Chloroflexota bacterium]
MPKGAVEETRAATRAVLLREKIRTLEVQAADFQGRPRDDAKGLLCLRDEVEEELSDLERIGLDLRPERTRVKTVDNILVRKAAALERVLGAQGGFAQVRQEINPPEAHWWWFLDDYLAERRRKRAIRFIVTVVVVAVLLIGANYVLNRFFGLDPQARQARNYLTGAEQALVTGNYDEAIEQYRRAIEAQPDLAEAYVGLGVLYELRGQEREAQEALAQAQALIPERIDYLLALARSYSSVGKNDKALQAANDAVELDPQSAQALLIRGGVYEAMGNKQAALTDYDRAATLAQEQGQDALYVLARMRLGMLLQTGVGGPGGSTGGGF